MDEKQHGAATQVGPSMAPKLEVTQGENAGETLKVKLTTRIGRERDNDIVIVDPKISRYHAQISMEAGQWTLTDLGSSNRTYLNGLAVTEPTPLQPGDRISLGETELTLTMPGQPITQPAPAEAPPAPTPIITPHRRRLLQLLTCLRCKISRATVLPLGWPGLPAALFCFSFW